MTVELTEFVLSIVIIFILLYAGYLHTEVVKMQEVIMLMHTDKFDKMREFVQRKYEEDDFE
jgi:hypothetical protein